MASSNMSDKELLTDLLNEEKNLLKEYATSITEASCSQLRQLMQNLLTECGQDQFSVFQQMEQRNMYQCTKATKQEVQSACQKSDTMKQDAMM